VNRLYFGDNLEVLRESIKDESVDLIYLDPPFNSNASYNLLFKSPRGQQSVAQVTAFEDSWVWGSQAELEYSEILRGQNTIVSELMQSLRKILGENNMMAYLTMMANRLLEMHRTLKATGSLYLHCDPTASHYLKILLDGVFGPTSYVNEIVWKRYGSHNDVGQGSKHFGRVHDNILFYGKTERRTWNQLFMPLDEEYVESTYRGVDEKTGKRFMTTPLTGPGGAEKGNPVYEWNGHTRAWRYSKQTMQQLHNQGKLYYSRTGYVRQKFYLEESKGTPVQSIWTDISSLSGAHAERLGFPTQKPLGLLERIVSASTNDGDVVLDPFCGCGTAVCAAQKLGREWIGIDVTHLAIAIVEKRLKDAYPGIKFAVHGTPNDIEGARNLAERDKYEFQYWACSLINAQPWAGRKKGADGGVDGVIYFQDEKDAAKKLVVSVKGGQNVSVQMLRDLRGVLEREKAAMGLFVTLADPTKPMRDEAVKAGFYVSAQGSNFPRIQILTIDGLLKKTERPKYPDPSLGGHTFKKSPAEHGIDKQGDLFPAISKKGANNVKRLNEGLLSRNKRKGPVRVTEARSANKRQGKAGKA
jgi:DNA modification methylase